MTWQLMFEIHAQLQNMDEVMFIKQNVNFLKLPLKSY